MTPAITVEKLTKRYGEHTVLKKIEFHVLKGEIFGLLGVNGAGKTTTLECMEGLRKYDEGNIVINGTVGIQLQSSTLPAYMRAMEAIQLFAKWNKTSIDQSMLRALGIQELGKKHYGALSTGQKRRLHLALSLLGDPDILFLDEPTAGLDVEGRIALHTYIQNLKEQGKTIVLTSHDMSEVESLCDHIAILHHGDIAFWGTMQEAKQTLKTSYQIEITTMEGITTYTADDISQTLLALLKDYQTRNVTIQDIKINRGTLEQLFIDFTKED